MRKRNATTRRSETWLDSWLNRYCTAAPAIVSTTSTTKTDMSAAMRSFASQAKLNSDCSQFPSPAMPSVTPLLPAWAASPTIPSPLPNPVSCPGNNTNRKTGSIKSITVADVAAVIDPSRTVSRICGVSAFACGLSSRHVAVLDVSLDWSFDLI